MGKERAFKHKIPSSNHKEKRCGTFGFSCHVARTPAQQQMPSARGTTRVCRRHATIMALELCSDSRNKTTIDFLIGKQEEKHRPLRALPLPRAAIPYPSAAPSSLLAQFALPKMEIRVCPPDNNRNENPVENAVIVPLTCESMIGCSYFFG